MSDGKTRTLQRGEGLYRQFARAVGLKVGTGVRVAERMENEVAHAQDSFKPAEAGSSCASISQTTT